MLSWGANSYGQLGQGIVSEECLKPTSVNEKSLGKIVQISGGAGHTLALNLSGHLWACGWNNVKQLGIDTETNTFKLVDCKTQFKQIACGWDFSAGITIENDLYLWGSNSYLKIDDSKIIDPPKKIISGVSYVACGLRHIAAVTEDDCVLVGGSNSNGQLGVISPALSLTKLSLSEVKMVACGQKHSLALTSKNELFAWGDNKWGQLGHDPKLVQKSVPIKVPFLKIISSIHCGWTHNVILTSDGELWSWGRNNYGQLGYESQNFSWVPNKIDLEKVTRVAVGAEHNIAIVGSAVYTWGWNEHGNCGDGSKQNIIKPKIIFGDEREVLCIGSGTGQSFIVLK